VRAKLIDIYLQMVWVAFSAIFRVVVTQPRALMPIAPFITIKAVSHEGAVVRQSCKRLRGKLAAARNHLVKDPHEKAFNSRMARLPLAAWS
jgi:hypothetical protein